MKQLLLGTPIGRMLLSGRQHLDMMRAAWRCSESIGTMANDSLAAELITRICRPGKVFVDVGAHIGSIFSAARRNDPSIKCVAIEAMPDKAANLRRRFPTVEIFECAAGDAEGEVSFFAHLKKSGYSSLGKPATDNHDVREIKVAVRRLDGLLLAEAVDAMKIDVEGAELGVLRGCQRILAAGRPTIMFESGPQEEDGLGYTKEALWQFLTDCNYAVLVPNRVAHNDPGLSREGFCESHLYPRRTTNYFAVAKERRVEIRDRARLIVGVKAA